MVRTNENFRTDIVALRALAVTLVLLGHFGIPGFSFGFIGVDVFFVISGFLITRLLYKEYISSSNPDPKKSSISLSNFYLRRIRRLVPAALTVILIVNVVSYFLSNQIARESLLSDSKWALLFLANVSFLRSGSDYFQQGSELSMLQHYWSLSVEEQFYFIWPILFLIAANLQRIKLLGKYVRFNIRLLFLISMISLFSFIFMLTSFNQSAVEAYFAIFTRAWELGVGSFFGILAYHKNNRSVYSRIEQYAPLIIAIAMSGLMINNKNWAYIIPFPVLATGIFLYFGQNRQNMNPPSTGLKSLFYRFSLYIGTISYSLYLVHWPILIIANRLEFTENLAMRIGMLPVSIVCGHFLWKYIEIPFQKIPLPKKSIWDERIFHFLKSRRLLISSVFMFTVGSLYVVTYPQVSSKVFYSNQSLEALSNDPNLKIFADYQSQILSGNTVEPFQSQPRTENPDGESPKNLDLLTQEIITAVGDGLKSTKLTQSEIVAFSKLTNDKSIFEKSSCYLSISEIPPNCAINGNSVTSKTVAIVGDSKMGFFAQPLIDYFKQKNWKIVPMIMTGCHLSDPSDAIRKNCTARSKWLLSEIESTRYDAIVSAEWPGRLRSDYQDRYYATLQKNTDKLIIFQTNTSIPNPVDCVASDYTFTERCTTRVSDGGNYKIAQNALRALKSSKTYVVESQNWICIAERCPLSVNGIFITRDGSHLSYSYVRTITPLIYTILDSILSG
jgi:peptidoglycan/LPS O-acetylase OafA/YrhL